MKIPEHFALSYLLAQFGAEQQYGPAGMGLMLLAGFLPDLDGLSLLVGWKLYRTCHRKVGHGILVTLAGPALLAWGASALYELGPFLPLWGWLQISLLAHLVTDVGFYNWPVQLLWPFTTRAWMVGLLTWNDLVPTLLLYAGTAIALLSPAAAPVAAGVSVTGLIGYLGWRAMHPRPRHGWWGWLTGNWALDAAPVWRWLTGDFLTW